MVEFAGFGGWGSRCFDKIKHVIERFVDVRRIEEAAGSISSVFSGTPQFVSEPLGDVLDCEALLKVETINPIRSFKGRGADFLARSTPREDVLVCASVGNLGQGLAYAGREHGLRVEIFASSTTSQLRLFRMEALGANVHLVDGDFDTARKSARDAAERDGWRLVEDGGEAALAEGAGTIAVELTRAERPIDFVLVPVGNGSLICGIAAWFKAVSPRTRVVAVGVTGSPAMERAWRTGVLEEGAPTGTIADGLAAREPVGPAVRAMRDTVDGYVLVDDDVLLTAMRLLLTRCGVVAEPSGAAGVAAALTMRDELGGASVALPVGGANVDADVLAQVL